MVLAAFYCISSSDNTAFCSVMLQAMILSYLKLCMALTIKTQFSTFMIISFIHFQQYFVHYAAICSGSL